MRFGLLYILLLYSHFFLLLFFLSVFRFFSSFSLVYTVKKKYYISYTCVYTKEKKVSFCFNNGKKNSCLLGKKKIFPSNSMERKIIGFFQYILFFFLSFFFLKSNEGRNTLFSFIKNVICSYF